jgi:MerR family mercuric resistance operon transcriptional regulator
MTQLSIGQLAKATGVTVEALRFYEKQGLVVTPARTDAGYRQYSPETVRRVKFIQHAKEVGFTLNDIGQLLALRQEPGTSCADIKLKATEKIIDVESKIKELQKIREALQRMVLKCTSKSNLSDCPILEELDFISE